MKNSFLFVLLFLFIFSCQKETMLNEAPVVVNNESDPIQFRADYKTEHWSGLGCDCGGPGSNCIVVGDEPPVAIAFEPNPDVPVEDNFINDNNLSGFIPGELMTRFLNNEVDVYPRWRNNHTELQLRFK